MQAEFSLWWARSKPIEEFAVGEWMADIHEGNPDDAQTAFGRFVCIVAAGGTMKTMFRLRPALTPQLVGSIFGPTPEIRRVEEAVFADDACALKDLVVRVLSAELVEK